MGVSEYVTIVVGLMLSVVGYLLVQRDSQRKNDIAELQTLIKETAVLVVLEKDKLAALVMSEKEKAAALVMSEKDKLAVIVKADHDKLEKEFYDFRMKVAEQYATTTLLEKVLQPILAHLGKIEDLLSTKLDRREFNEHREFDKRAREEP